MWKQCLPVVLFLGFVDYTGFWTAAFAQVVPASRGGTNLWVGGSVSSFNPDYGSISRLYGPGVFVDYNLTSKLALEGDARWLRFHGDQGETQSDYLAGVDYRVYRLGSLSLLGQFLLGGVSIHYPDDIGAGRYFAYAPGGVIGYRVSRRLSVRGDYQYQLLPSAPGFAAQISHGLTPSGVSLGVSYRVFGPH